MGKQTVCLDFNGVLDTYTGWIPGDDGTGYTPRDGVRKFLEYLSHRYTVVVCSAIKANLVWRWLDRWNLAGYVTEVTNTKPKAMAYIDDRAIRFDGNYEDVLSQLQDFKPYWKE